MSAIGRDRFTFFLGLQVKQSQEGIFISQDKYVAEILKKFDFVSVKSAITPMETKAPLAQDEGSPDVDLHLYRSMIGCLMYLTASRPDIMYAVCACSRFQVTPKVSHLYAVKRIFKYIKGKPKLGLWYPRESPLDLVAYSDSDYAAANLDRKSTTGGCQFLGRRLISWQCKKQTIVATSTTEAEYVAAASCCGQVLWLQNQLLDYGFNFMNTIIHIDNQSTICIIKNPVYHSKTKHIEIRHHFIRDCYEKKLIQVRKFHTDLIVARSVTKHLMVKVYLVVGDVCRLKLAWKRTCNCHLLMDANRLDSGFPQKVKIEILLNYTITEESVRRQLQLADDSGITMLQNEEIFEGLQNIGSKSGGWDQFGSNIATALICQAQPSDAPTSSQPISTATPPPVQITTPPITSTPPSTQSPPLTQPVPSTTPPLQPSKGPTFEPSYHLSPPPSHEPENQAFRSSEENEQLRNLMDIVPRLQSRVESLEKEGQDQEVPFETDQGDTFATPEKSKGSGEAQEEQIRSKIDKRKPKSTKTPTKILHFEEPDSAQVNTAQVNTAELNPDSTPSAQVNTGEVNAAEFKHQACASKELQELADLEEAQRLQAKMDAETQRQIDLDALLARRLVEQEEEAAQEALATEFDYIQARLNADQILGRRKLQQEEREQYSMKIEQSFYMTQLLPKGSFLQNKESCMRDTRTSQTFGGLFGTEEDERAIKKMNEKAIHKEEEKKDESVHEEVKEEEGAKKRKLGTRRKLKAKRDTCSGLTKKMMI
ncbi:hypothetical protein Tco_1262062 [Tanacetum coccineum]